MPLKKRNQLAFEEAKRIYNPSAPHGGSGHMGERCRWPMAWVRKILSFNQYKKYDFVFIGRIHRQRGCRKWIYDFIEKHFTPDSFLYFTDGSPAADRNSGGDGKIPRGFENKPYYKSEFRELFLHKMPGDVTLSKSEGRLLVEGGLYGLDTAYWKVMCQSQFALCPGGHMPWSMRFFEAGLAKAVPIISHEQEKGAAKKFRSIKDLQFNISHKDMPLLPDPALIRHNFEAFLKQFTFFSEEQVQQLMKDYKNPPKYPPIESITLDKKYPPIESITWDKLVKKYSY